MALARTLVKTKLSRNPGTENLGPSFMNKRTSTSAAISPPVSRRHFLRHSSFALAGAAALSDFPWVRKAHAAPDDPIRIGLIGCGGGRTPGAAEVAGAAT